MSIEMKTNLATAIQEKQHVVANRLNYTSVHSVYVNVQDSTHTFKAVDLLQHGWSYNVHWKIGREGVHMKNDIITNAAIRETIADSLQLPIDEIDPNLRINARGNGTPFLEVANGQFAWETYTVGYSQRKLEEELVFDQEKYDAALEVCDQNINMIMESMQVAGNVAVVDAI